MEELFEFRMDADEARRHLGPRGAAAAERGAYGVARILIRRDDPFFERIGAVDKEFQSRGEALVTYWEAHRKYEPHELERALAFKWYVSRAFEPIGEECGTIYDDSRACEWCGRGRVRRSALRLRRKSLPRRRIDAARTIAGEVIISARFVESWRRAEMTGATFGEVEDEQGNEIEEWQALDVTAFVDVASPPTGFGDTPWSTADPLELCKLGHVGGRNITTELTIKHPLTTDLAATTVAIGQPGNTLRAEPMLVISPKLYQSFTDELRVGLVERSLVVRH